MTPFDLFYLAPVESTDRYICPITIIFPYREAEGQVARTLTPRVCVSNACEELMTFFFLFLLQVSTSLQEQRPKLLEERKKKKTYVAKRSKRLRKYSTRSSARREGEGD